MKLLFVGDVMPGGILHYQKDFIDKDLLDKMSQYDLRIGTLECAVGNDIPIDPNKQEIVKPVVYVRNEDLEKVVELGLNAVSLANNHVFDLGIEGFLNTIAQLDRLGIKRFGAGRNFEEARKPFVFDLPDGNQAAIIGCLVDYPKPVIFYPPSDSSPCLNYQSVEGICNDIREAKKNYRYVLVMPHWGLEHIYLQPLFFKDAAYKIVDAGADCILGGHPHIINPVIRHKGVKIYFSMGNFLFADRVVTYPRRMYYPPIEEKKGLEKCWAQPYPKNKKEPFVCVWPGKNRIGMTIGLEINNGVRSKYDMVCFDKEDKLHQYHSWFVRVRFIILGWLVNFPKYSWSLHLYNSSKNKISAWLNGRRAFNYPIDL